MVADQHKWWRWLGEESLSGGTIGLHEGGGTFPCGQRRPSQHSMMRWIGFDFDQIGLEHMVARITGMRNAGPDERAEHARRAPSPRDRVLWLETGHPRFHELNVTWRIGGPTGPVIATGNSRNLDLEPLNLRAGHRRARRGARPGRAERHRLGAQPVDRTTAATDSGYNGPRFVQTREWTVGDTTVTPSPPAAEITASTATTPAGRRRRGRLRRDQPPDRPRPRRHVVAQRRRRSPNPTQQPQPRPRRAEPAGRAPTR